MIPKTNMALIQPKRQQRSHNAIAASFRDIDRDDERSDERSGEKKRDLKKKLREEALERMENAARTRLEYNEVIRVWNHLDDNRERRE